MENNEIQFAIDRIKKNPHVINRFTLEELYDMLQFVRSQYDNAALFYAQVWALNKHVSLEYPDINEYIKRQSTIKMWTLVYNSIEAEYVKKNSNSLSNNQSCKNNELSHRQNALIRIYKGGQIKRDEVGMYRYRGLQLKNDRLAEPKNTKAYNDFVKDLNVVILNLTEPYKSEAIDELKIYETRYKNTYS